MPPHLSRRMRALLLPLLVLPACKSWSAQPIPAPTSPVHNPPGDVRLHLRDGSRIVMHDVAFRGDSVTGRYARDTTRRALPLTDVVGVEEESVNAGRTTLLVAGIAAGVLAVVIGLAVAAGPIPY